MISDPLKRSEKIKDMVRKDQRQGQRKDEKRSKIWSEKIRKDQRQDQR